MRTSALRLAFLSAFLLACAALSSCVQKMGKHGHLRPQEGDPALLRIPGAPPAGTLPQSSPAQAVHARVAMPPITRDLLRIGREQYSVSCVPCHGPSGHGDGMIVQRGFLAPPSYHTERLRQVSDQHFYDVITQGFGAMYSYADRVAPADRWAIVAYIRALQLSQNAKWTDLTQEDQAALGKDGSR